MIVKNCRGEEYDASRFWVEVKRSEYGIYYFLYCEHCRPSGSVHRAFLEAFREPEEALDRLEKLQEALKKETES